MGIATCYPCAKYLLLALNLLFWLSGFALVTLGFYCLLRPDIQQIIHLFNFSTFPLSSIEILACFIILIGIIVFLIGLFGYCGARHESRTCLILYILMITCVLLAELALFVFISIYHEQGHKLIKQHLISEVKNYNFIYPDQYERALDYVQNKYNCCGIDSAYDYIDSNLPLSCCSMMSTRSCTAHQIGLVPRRGCFHSFVEKTYFWAKFFILFELSLCLLSFIGIFLAICVCQHTMTHNGYMPAGNYI